MADLATVDDVSVLLGYPVPADQVDRVTALLSMASSVVNDAVTLPTNGTVPRSVTYVTASLVVRTMANPGQLSTESIGTYRVGYGGGMTLTDDDRDTLGPWLSSPADGAYMLALGGLSYGVWPPWDWERDLDAEAAPW